MKSCIQRPLAFALLCALAAFAVISSACSQPAAAQVRADLLEPPNVPDALPRSRAHVTVNLEAVETEAEIAPGVTYKLWTFNGTVPGPMIRVHEGDTVDIVLTNNGSSTVTHNIDLHAVNGPGGGAGASNVAPGETKSFSFKALSAGLFTYHCAAGLVADHIANGMYGAILVEPEGGLPKVDHEYYIGQSDFYLDGETGEPGSFELDINKLLDERPTYVLFNGHTKSLTGEKALTAKVGETVRIYFTQGGPNQTSSFHVIGEIFDKAWPWGTLESLPIEGVQTISVPPGGAVIVQFKVDVPGDYKLVDHALGRVAKGAAGTLTVTGENDARIFDPKGSSGSGSHEMPGITPLPAAEITGGTFKLTMKDNQFDPKALMMATGAKVSFDLPNVGKVPHNLRIAPLDGNFDAPAAVVSVPEIVTAGKSGKLEWTAPATPGTYNFRCDIHPTEMTGSIVVH